MSNIKRTQIREIGDDEIRIIGADFIENFSEGDGENNNDKPNPRRGCWWLLLATIAVALVAGLIYLYIVNNTYVEVDDESYFEENITTVETPQPTIEVTPLGTTPDSTLKYVELIDTTINDIPLRIYIPHNARMSLMIGSIQKAADDAIYVAQAADIRRDNRDIVGTFVLDGELLVRGSSKRGYCAVIDSTITIGVKEFTPLLEKAIEREGSFFRQYPLVDNGKLVENKPKNKSFRRSLCDRNGEIMMIECLTQESFHDFAQALVDLHVSNAIYLVGGGSYGWAVDKSGERHYFGTQSSRYPKKTSYIVWR